MRSKSPPTIRIPPSPQHSKEKPKKSEDTLMTDSQNAKKKKMKFSQKSQEIENVVEDDYKEKSIKKKLDEIIAKRVDKKMSPTQDNKKPKSVEKQPKSED